MDLIDNALFVAIAVAFFFAVFQEIMAANTTKSTDVTPLRKRVLNVLLAFTAAAAACFACQTIHNQFGDSLQIFLNTAPVIQRDKVKVITENPVW